LAPEEEKCYIIFRTVLDNAVSRLEDMCQEWLHIQSSVPDVPLETSDLISAAVGQTQLLLRSKFSQFRDLINKCEKSLEGETKEPVTCSDLEGFWDMVFIQVKEFVIPTFT
jgi:disks large-associated protein 5